MTLEELVAAIKGGKVGDKVDMAGIIQQAMDAQTATVAGLKQKNSTLVTSNSKLKQTVDGLPEGFNQELWNELMAEHSSKEDNKLKAEGKWNELKDQLVEQHTKDTGKMQKIVDALKSALSVQLIDNAAVEAITSAQGNSALLLPHIKANLKMMEGDDGTYSTIVADASGEARFSKLKAGESMGIEELVNEFKADKTFAAAFVAPSGGGGAGGNGQAGFNGKNPFAKGKDFNYTEQAKLVKSDPKLAEQMRASAA